MASNSQGGGEEHFLFDREARLMVKWQSERRGDFWGEEMMIGKFLAAGVCLLVLSGAPGAFAQQPAATATDTNADTQEYVIPEGTEFKLSLHTTISSRLSHPGDRVLCTLIDPVPVEDTEVLGRGLRIDGHLGEVQSARHRGKGGLLTIVFDTVELPSGEKISILGSLTEIFASENGATPAVGPEGELKGKGPNRLKQAAIIAIPTAAVAAVAAPGPTIATGAGMLVAALLVPKGKQAMLSAGSLIGMRLDKDVTIKVPVTESESK